MTTQSDRELDWSLGRELERKDAEIATLREMIGILEEQFERQSTALRRIVNLGEKNVPKYAQEIAREALASLLTSADQGAANE